jgi:hypothetical protein
MCRQLGRRLGIDGPASVLGAVSKLLFNFKQQVILCGSFSTARRPSLDLSDAGCHAEISNCGIVGLAGTRGHDRGIVMCVGEFYAPQGLGHGANLVQVDKNGICDAFGNASLEDFRIRYKNIVANQLNPVAKALRERLPPWPIVLSKAPSSYSSLPVGPD